MPKLNTRQIIILGVMVLAILYGAYDFLSGGRKGQALSTVKKTSDLNAIMGMITSAMGEEAASSVDAHVIKRAEAEWPRDPFYEPVDKREEAVEKAAAQAEHLEAVTAALKGRLNYTGYIETGSKKIAIINGNEYVAGDSLDVEGCVLNGIYPEKILVYNRTARLTVEIPLKE